MSTRSCNLDLEHRVSSSDECSGSSSHHRLVSQDKQQQQQQQQQLTIFYNGVMCICDVTELHARAILCVASNETRETMVNTNSTPSPSEGYKSSPPGVHYSQLCSTRVAAGGLSMKMSLQKFLQKRKHRSQATHPYHRRIVN